MALHDIVWNVLIDQDYDGIVTWQEVLDSRARYIEPGVLGPDLPGARRRGCKLRSRTSPSPKSRGRTICP
jgi:hypothetical protein